MGFSSVIGFPFTCFEGKRQGIQCWGEYKAAQFTGKWDLPDMDVHMLVLWSRFLWSNLKHKSLQCHNVCLYKPKCECAWSFQLLQQSELSLPELCEMRWQSIFLISLSYSKMWIHTLVKCSHRMTGYNTYIPDVKYMNYTIPVNLHILIYLNANNSWVISYCKNLKIVQNSSLWILSAPSGVPLHPSPSGLFPASQPWALNSYLLLQLPLGAVSSPLLPATVPTSQDTSWASPSTVAYSHILTLRLCPNLLQSACAVHLPLPTLLNTPLGPCWLWCLLRLSTWLSTGHLPAQHVNFVTSAWSPAPLPPYHLKQELLALTIDASHSELR